MVDLFFNDLNYGRSVLLRSKLWLLKSDIIPWQVLGSITWTVWVTLKHTQIGLILPREDASFLGRQTTLSYKTERNQIVSGFNILWNQGHNSNYPLAILKISLV